MYVRDRNFDGDETDFFTMAEYCQVFLTAHFIKEDKEDHIPLIERGRVGRMSKEIGDIVCKEMDEMFNIAVRELEKFADAPEQFSRKWNHPSMILYLTLLTQTRCETHSVM